MFKNVLPAVQHIPPLKKKEAVDFVVVVTAVLNAGQKLGCDIIKRIKVEFRDGCGSSLNMCRSILCKSS